MKYIFIYKGSLPSKANYKEIGYRRINGELKPFIRNKKQVLIFQNEAIYQLHKQILSYGYEKFPLKNLIKIKILFFLKRNFEKRDLDNLEKFLFDVLEKANIIKNDAQIVKKEAIKLKYKEEGFFIEIENIKNLRISKQIENSLKIFQEKEI